jgi:hypothetical protein
MIIYFDCKIIHKTETLVSLSLILTDWRVKLQSDQKSHIIILLYLPNIAVKQLVLQPHILQIPASNHSSETGCHILSPSSKMSE